MSDAEQLGGVAEEQAALRRIASLVAQGASQGEMIGAIVAEIGRLLDADAAALGRYEPDDTITTLGSWSAAGGPIDIGTRFPLERATLAGAVAETGRVARLDAYEDLPGPLAAALRERGWRSALGAPVVIGGHRWGVIGVASTSDEPLPPGTEGRLEAFTELLATAIASVQSREEEARLAAEQAALRRVATLVAQDAPHARLFAAATEEVGRLLGASAAGMVRYDDDGFLTVLASWSRGGEKVQVGRRWRLEGESLAPVIWRSGRPERIDDWSAVGGPIAQHVRDTLGYRSSVGCPIVFGGRAWGAVMVHTTEGLALPADTEERVGSFAELVATAIANAEARAEVRRLADEQAALRRVATLVARQAPADEVFAAVAEEVGRLLGVDDTRLARYEPDDSVTALAGWGALAAAIPVGTNLRLGEETVAMRVLRSERPARIDDYSDADDPALVQLRERGMRSALGAPIVVEGRLWGVIMLTSVEGGQPLRPDAELRITDFTELLATAIANITAREELAASRARIVEAADAERRRVVRDLHDGAQQRLVHTVITLKLAHRALPHDGEQASTLVAEALQQAERATAELRELSHGILPEVLTLGGLRAGAESLASRMPVPTELDVSVGRLPPPIEAAAYFVVAEALTNVAKHAQAGRAEVSAGVEEDTLCIRVRDDGVGGARAGGPGLQGLHDRLAAHGGRLRVESPAGAGTQVTATIPLRDLPAAGADALR